MLTEVSYRDELSLVTYFARELERQLSGRTAKILLRRVPSDVCHLGVIAPSYRRPEEPETGEEEEFDEDRDANSKGLNSPVLGPPSATSSGGGDTELHNESIDIEPPESPREFTRRPPSALGVQLLVQPEDGPVQLSVHPRFAIYTRHFPTYSEQKSELGQAADEDEQDEPVSGNSRSVRLVDVYVRREIDPGPVSVKLDPNRPTQRVSDSGLLQSAMNKVLQEATCDKERPIWRPTGRRSTVTSRDLESADNYREFINQFTGDPPSLSLRALLDVRARRTSTGALRLRIYLRNVTAPDSKYDTFNIFADAGLEIELKKGTLVPIELVPVAEDYQYDREVWAVGHACSVEVSQDHRFIVTKTLAKYYQARMTSRDVPPARIAELAQDPFVVLGHIYEAMSNHAATWRNEFDEWVARGPGDDQEYWQRELKAREADLSGFCDEIDRFAAGVAALRSDERLLEAFKAMHRVFERVGKGRYERWRLFQIVFIVSQLPALAVREGLTEAEWPEGHLRQWPNVLDSVDVLWFPTGGGKTEAYFGLISCAILYDRLRGKSAGVTAWLRFPLRMLSVQQLQRAALMIWETERERQVLEKKMGLQLGDAIAMGYLVGNEMTPNDLRKGEGKWALDRIEQDDTLREKVHLIRTCLACGGQIMVKTDQELFRIRLVCVACGKEMPIFVSDSETCRFLPSLVVGTVDKIASVAYRSALSSLWDGPNWKCPNPGHGYGTGRWCGVPGCTTNPKGEGKPKKRVPVALKDPSPAFHVQDELHLLRQELGAFAGHYETMLRLAEENSSGLPSKIIAATATIEGYEHQARHIYGAPKARRFPGRDRDLSNTFYSMPSVDDSGNPKVMRLYMAFQPPHLTPADAAALCSTILHNTIRRLYSNPYGTVVEVGLQDAKTEEEVRALLNLYDTTVTYVGSKQYGTRVHEDLERSSDDLYVRMVSGETPFGEINKIIDDLEHPPTWGHPDHLDALVATSLISHGVDVERVNLMVMDKVPGEVAEYIQASSRSGRKHAGLVIATLPRYSLRATSIYHRFHEFHKHLDRMIGPVPVNRFAKQALQRTFPGVMLGALFSWHLKDASENVLDYKRALNGPLSCALDCGYIIKLAERVYGLNRGAYPPALEEQMRRQIQDQAVFFTKSLARARASGGNRLTQAFTPHPMTSLRDVDVSLPLRLSGNVSETDLRWYLRHS